MYNIELFTKRIATLYKSLYIIVITFLKFLLKQESTILVIKSKKCFKKIFNKILKHVTKIQCDQKKCYVF